MKQISERVQLVNDKTENTGAKYVLYRMQMPRFRQNTLYDNRHHGQKLRRSNIHRMDKSTMKSRRFEVRFSRSISD